MMRIVAVFRALRQAETAGLANSTRRPPKSGSARRNQEIPRHPGHLGFKIRQRLNVSRAKSYFSTLTPSARSALLAMSARVKKFVMSFLKIAGSWVSVAGSAWWDFCLDIQRLRKPTRAIAGRLIFLTVAGVSCWILWVVLYTAQRKTVEASLSLAT